MSSRFSLGQAEGAIKRSSITGKYLRTGELSVWRASALARLSEELAGLLQPKMQRHSGERFDEIRAAVAALIGNFRIGDQPNRAFSLIDDCTIDDQGNKHRAHAHNAICKGLWEQINPTDEPFLVLQEGHKLIFEGNSVWRKAD